MTTDIVPEYENDKLPKEVVAALNAFAFFWEQRTSDIQDVAEDEWFNAEQDLVDFFNGQRG